MPVSPLELIGPILMLAAIATALLRWPRPVGRLTIAVAAVALAFLPFGSVTIGAFMLALFGPVSAATIVLCAIYLHSAVTGSRMSCLPSRAFLLCLIVTGVAFYPLTFGLSAFDPYDLGYRGLTVPTLMLCYLLVGWFAGARDIACWIGLAALLYLIDANDSRNLWDYLLFPLDPIAAALGLGWSLRRAPRAVDQRTS